LNLSSSSLLLLSTYFLLSAFAPAPAAAETVEVTARRANLRPGPSTGRRPVGTALEGDRFEVRSRDGRWLEVLLPDGGTAWLRDDLVREVRQYARRRRGRRSRPAAVGRARPREPAPVRRDDDEPFLTTGDARTDALYWTIFGWAKMVGGAGSAAVGLLYFFSGASEYGTGLEDAFAVAAIAGGGATVWWGTTSLDRAERIRAEAGLAASPARPALVGWSWRF